MCRSTSFLVFVTLFTSLNLLAQEPSLGTLNQIAQECTRSLQAQSQPAAWIQLDKKLYTAGETVWYAIRLLSDHNHQVYRREKTVYVQLLNPNDSVCHTHRLSLSAPSLSGSFLLPDTLAAGHYKLVAFTPSMLQSESARVGLASFQVLNIAETQSPGDDVTRSNIQVMKIPALRLSCSVEGQSLISGVENPVVCVAYDSLGQPVSLQGMVRNAVDRGGIPFHTNLQGVAKFTLNAAKNRKYWVSAAYNGKEYTDTLWPSGPRAAQVILTPSGSSSRKARVALGDSLYYLKAKTHVLAYSNGSLRFAASGSGMYEVQIPLEAFPRGLATIGLYNDRGDTLSHRAFWVKRPNLDISLTRKPMPIAPREAVELNLQFRDLQHQPVVADFSVSVTDGAFNSGEYNDTGNDQPYLTNPADYLPQFPKAFTANLKNDSATLDHLLIASGSMHSSPPSAPPLPEEPFRLSGSVYDHKGNRLPGHVITIFANQGGSLVRSDTTDAKGNFQFILPEFFGFVLFSFQVSKLGSIRTDVKVVVDAQQQPRLPSHILAQAVTRQAAPPSAMSREAAAAYKHTLVQRGFGSGKITVLPTVTVTGQRSAYEDIIARKRVSRNSWIATPEFIDQAGEGNLSNVVLSAPGVMMMNGFVTIQGGIRGIKGIVNAKVEPLVVVNGVQVNVGDVGDIGLNVNVSPVLNYLNTFSNRNVEFIEVLTGSQAAQFGTVGGNGVILVYTSPSARTGLNENESTKGFTREFVEGYELPESFPVTDYAVKSKKTITGADRRITLHWNGQVQTDKEGKATLRFFYSDYPGPLSVHISGVAGNGELFTKSFLLQ